MAKNKFRRGFSDAFARLAAQEAKFFGSDFLAPAMKGRPVRVRLSGVVLNFMIVKPKNYEGWGVFRPTSSKTAEYVREATMAERRQYLSLFPSLRLVICDRKDDQYFGILSNRVNCNSITGVIPIRFATEVQMFEKVVTRFDGETCWFDGPDTGASLRNAVTLRESLASEKEDVDFPGLTAEEKDAYTIAYIRQIEDKKDRNEERIKAALGRAGAQYRSYIERGDTYTVEYVVAGETHRSVVKKDTLEVQSAGICLSGGDRSFDLQSLVSVIREGINRGKIVNVGLGGNYGYAMREPGDGPDEMDDDYD